MLVNYFANKKLVAFLIILMPCYIYDSLGINFSLNGKGVHELRQVQREETRPRAKRHFEFNPFLFEALTFVSTLKLWNPVLRKNDQ